MKPSVKIALGILTSVLTIAFILVYDLYIRERIDSVQVVVVKPGAEIIKSEPITEDKLMIERRAKPSLIKDVVLADEMQSIIGLDASQIIEGNSMVTKKMVDFDGLVPNKKAREAIRPITKSMIYAEPGSLRRKDSIDIYLVKPEDPSLNQGHQKTEKTSDGEVAVEEKSSLGLPILQNVKVVYVKDSGNKEVVSADENNPEDKRMNGTSVISDLEVILNEDDFQKLMEQVLNQGYKLYITYN